MSVKIERFRRPKPQGWRSEPNGESIQPSYLRKLSYDRARDLPRLLFLWPHEIADRSRRGQLHILACLRRALGAEKRRALAGHMNYDLNRHLSLFCALKTEQARFALAERRLVGQAAKGSLPRPPAST